MPALLNQSLNQVLAKDITKAESLTARIKGLLGKADMASHKALWIPRCPAIHTFFMQFSLDLIFTNRSLQVVSVFHSVPSGKIIFGGWGSYHVFEFKGAILKTDCVKKGDKLHVVH